jgi:ubiquinone/menaquinone biosynthesis C-methylase UbiE
MQISNYWFTHKAERKRLLTLLGKFIDMKAAGHIDFSQADEELYSIFNDHKKIDEEQKNRWGAPSERRVANRVADVASYLTPSANYVDIGAGTGDITIAIGHRIKARTIYAVDIENNLDKLYVANNVQHWPPDCLKEIEDESVGIVTAFQSLHHVRNLEEELGHIGRILAKGGHLIIREHDNSFPGLTELADIEHILYDVINSGKTLKAAKDDHWAEYRSREEWTALLGQYGLELIEYKETKWPTPTNYYYAFYRKK